MHLLLTAVYMYSHAILMNIILCKNEKTFSTIYNVYAAYTGVECMAPIPYHLFGTSYLLIH